MAASLAWLQQQDGMLALLLRALVQSLDSNTPSQGSAWRFRTCIT